MNSDNNLELKEYSALHSYLPSILGVILAIYLTFTWLNSDGSAFMNAMMVLELIGVLYAGVLQFQAFKDTPEAYPDRPLRDAAFLILTGPLIYLSGTLGLILSEMNTLSVESFHLDYFLVILFYPEAFLLPWLAVVLLYIISRKEWSLLE